ncbi:CDP-glycerol glycerophosphotransferase family protein [Pediococcus ethanolidurans]|uniref:CDP-glycerol glycerophosphotransferase family protein n=1 Tax=Pediococcus ethanolidurans TaxID=319653 RepID=UPI00345EAAB3
MKNLIRTFLYWISGFSKRDKTIILFGSWFGERFSDNPKFLLMQLNCSEKKCYWIGNEKIRKEVEFNHVNFVRRNSFKAFWLELKAGYAFVSHGYQDLGSVSLLRGNITVQLWHGFPIKRIGADDKKNKKEGNKIFESYSFFLANSPLMKKRIISAFKYYGANEKNVVLAQQPRVNYLSENIDNINLRIEIRKRIGVSEYQTMILYLPTFRNKLSDSFSFYNQQSSFFEKLDKKSNFVFVERQHFASKTHKNVNKEKKFVIEMNSQIDVQDALLAADILVTDYSSVYVDFLVLKRPIIHFIFDNKNYEKKDRGIYNTKFENEAAGPIVYNTGDLADLLNSIKKKKSRISNETNMYKKIYEEEQNANIFELVERLS